MKSNAINRLSEKIYQYSFLVFVGIVLLSTIGNGVVRYLLTKLNCVINKEGIQICTDSTIELVPQNAFDFIYNCLWVFVLPQTVILVGDYLPILLDFYKEFNNKKNQILNPEKSSSEENL